MPNLIEYLIQSDLHSAWEDVEKTLSNSAPPGADIAAIVENIKVLINDVNAPAGPPVRTTVEVIRCVMGCNLGGMGYNCPLRAPQ